MSRSTTSSGTTTPATEPAQRPQPNWTAQVTVETAGVSPDEVLSLYRWLVGEEDLRGRARLVPCQPEPGSLGAVTDALVVALGPGGAATVFAAALIAWIRRRAGSVTCKLSRPDGTVIEVSAQKVRGLDADGVRVLVGELARRLGEAPGNQVAGREPGSG